LPSGYVGSKGTVSFKTLGTNKSESENKIKQTWRNEGVNRQYEKSNRVNKMTTKKKGTIKNDEQILELTK
jgi:hypothetical protein